VKPLDRKTIRTLVNTALREDVGPGDATTLTTVPADSVSEGVILARTDLCLSGGEFARETFRQTCRKFTCKIASDGHFYKAGTVLLRLKGDTRGLLTGERVALNFLQHLSGIATLTRRFVEETKGTKARILDTRKTIPGWRWLAKYAVACGGGQNHRFGLYDMVLIKDNHLVALQDAEPNAIAAAVARARKLRPRLKVEVEADRLDQVEQAVAAGADIILLDNMSLAELRKAVKLARGKALTEASGGVNLKTVRSIAKTGVDYISVGALTHSAPAADIGLDFG
jgi:nicotinate-nucleotide pyrophosphorylase (carboxylating)